MTWVAPYEVDEKKGPDWHAEKIARKLAQAPEVDADLVALTLTPTLTLTRGG